MFSLCHKLHSILPNVVKHRLHVCLGVRPGRIHGVPQLAGHELALGPADVEAEAEHGEDGGDEHEAEHPHQQDLRRVLAVADAGHPRHLQQRPELALQSTGGLCFKSGVNNDILLVIFTIFREGSD